MKQYISTNWKKILYVICGLILLLNLVLTLRTPNKVVSDYYEYGPKYETGILDIDADGQELTDDLIERTADETGTSFDTAKLIVVFIVLFLACLILDDIMQGKEKKK
ncbi:MAG: hypothetical protein IKR04_06030 [Clostridia bacterium]|nr:hypothetical protein [Clostridia bacterium]